jgi:putative DNA primase/helicase
MYDNFIEEFREYARSQGFELPADIYPDGRYHRCHDRRDKRGTKNVWYVLNDETVPRGAVGYWRTQEHHSWSANGWKRLSREEWRAIRAKSKAEAQQRRLNEKNKHDAASMKAKEIWASGNPADPNHAYLRDKGISPCGVRQGEWHNDYIDADGVVRERIVRDALLIPLINGRGETRSMQGIFPDKQNVLGRRKDFLPGGELAGCFYPIGKVTDVGGRRVIVICEGFATAASIHQSTRLAVCTAFSAGNLQAVARAARVSDSDAVIIVAADNDRWTTNPIDNPGVTKARAAAVAVGGCVVVPEFKSLEGRPTDFNDLCNREGECVVKDQIMAVVAGAVSACNEAPEVIQGANGSAVDIAPPASSEDALALSFAERNQDYLRYVKEQGAWYVNSGRKWEEDKTGRALDRARAECRRAAADPDAKGLSEGQVRSLASSKTASAVLKLASADRRLALTADRFDCDPWALNTPAGIVDLQTGALRAIRPTDYMTMITAVGPDAACPVPLWTEFLKRVMTDDQDLILFMQRFLGYCLTGVTREQVLAFLFGTGANGKSVFMNTVFGVMGDYHKTAAMETFTESKFDRHPTELAALQYARAVSAAETEEGRHLAIAKIKRFTGGEKITAHRMRQDPYEYQPQFKLVFAGNHMPALRSVDESVRRRFLMVPFVVTIPPEQRDLDLEEKLKAEWPGILAWMIQGCLEWQRRGLSRPASISAATQDYMEGEDTIAAWIDDCCIVDPDAWTTTRELYHSWKSWADDAGERVVEEKRFVELLGAHGYKRHRRAAGRGFDGLKLPASCYYGSDDGYAT